MSQRPFRFIHAGDLHLEQPLIGLSETPDHLRGLFLDAPYIAATRVFDAALAEDVRFLILSGDVLHPLRTGPRGPLFLIEQFNRLARRDISVYWAGGEVDPPDVWPSAFALPQNVHVFPSGGVEEQTYSVDGVPLASILGQSRDGRRAVRPADFSPDSSGLFTVAVAHGEPDPAALQSRGIDYWALGGRHDRATPSSGPHVVHYCGAAQARRPDELGVHGCTLVQVDEQGHARTTLIPTDALRWVAERIAIDETTTRDDLEGRLRDRIDSLVESASSVALLIAWTIAGRGPLANALRRSGLSSEIIQNLRAEYGRRSPPAWTIALAYESPETLPSEWYEQETIRGDYLRAIRQLQMNPDDPIGLENYVSESYLAGSLAEAIAFPNKAARNRALREAAALGVDLLSGEEVCP